MAFRDRRFATLRAVRPVLEEPGILIVGSEVPNGVELLEAPALAPVRFP